MHRTLIVARMDPGDSQAVADIFAESDATTLPDLVGVARRTLFTFHDLYFHLAESDGDLARQVSKVREHPLFRDISRRLDAYVRPYDPSWRAPKDAMATPFYSWQRDD